MKTCLDTNILAYFAEGHAVYGPKVKRLLKKAALDKMVIGITFLSVAELLVKPLEENNETLADFYHGLEKSLGIKTLYPTEQTAALTAVLRAKYRIPTPDALNIAIAVSNFYSVFLTNDKTLQKVTEIKISGLGSSSSPAP